MAPINLAVSDITCKQIETIFKKLFCSITRYVKKTNNDYLDIFTIMHFTHLEASTIKKQLNLLVSWGFFLVLQNLDDGSTNKLFFLFQKNIEDFIYVSFQ